MSYIYPQCECGWSQGYQWHTNPYHNTFKIISEYIIPKKITTNIFMKQNLQEIVGTDVDKIIKIDINEPMTTLVMERTHTWVILYKTIKTIWTQYHNAQWKTYQQYAESDKKCPKCGKRTTLAFVANTTEIYMDRKVTNRTQQLLQEIYQIWPEAPEPIIQTYAGRMILCWDNNIYVIIDKRHTYLNNEKADTDQIMQELVKYAMKEYEKYKNKRIPP